MIDVSRSFFLFPSSITYLKVAFDMRERQIFDVHQLQH